LSESTSIFNDSYGVNTDHNTKCSVQGINHFAPWAEKIGLRCEGGVWLKTFWFARKVVFLWLVQNYAMDRSLLKLLQLMIEDIVFVFKNINQSYFLLLAVQGVNLMRSNKIKIRNLFFSFFISKQNSQATQYLKST